MHKTEEEEKVVACSTNSYKYTVTHHVYGGFLLQKGYYLLPTYSQPSLKC